MQHKNAPSRRYSTLTCEVRRKPISGSVLAGSGRENLVQRSPHSALSAIAQPRRDTISHAGATDGTRCLAVIRTSVKLTIESCSDAR